MTAQAWCGSLILTSPQGLLAHRLVYLATPYSNYKGRNITLAFEHAAAIAANLSRFGVRVFSPISHTHPLAIYGGIDPFDQSIWISFDEAMMAASDALCVATAMEGWDKSFGIGEEVKTFLAAGKPIYRCAIGWER